jgi:hypothetical protein
MSSNSRSLSIRNPPATVFSNQERETVSETHTEQLAPRGRTGRSDWPQRGLFNGLLVSVFLSMQRTRALGAQAAGCDHSSSCRNGPGSKIISTRQIESIPGQFLMSFFCLAVAVPFKFHPFPAGDSRSEEIRHREYRSGRGRIHRLDDNCGFYCRPYRRRTRVPSNVQNGPNSSIPRGSGT